MYNNNQNSNSSQTMVPEAKQALDNMKYEIAGELGINLKQGYNGDLPSRQAGSIGGYMVNLLLPAERISHNLSWSRFRYSRSFLRNHKKIKVEYITRFCLRL